MKKYIRVLSLLLVLLLPVVFTSCQKNSYVYSAGDSAFSASIARAKDADGVELEDADMESVVSAARNVFSSSLAMLDGSSAAFREINSDVDAVFDCDAELLRIIKRTVELSIQTDGVFQPCGGAYSALYNGGEAVPTEEELAAALEHVGTDKFEILESSVKKNDRLAAFDLSAVAEGYAMQKAVELIESEGIEYGTVTSSSTVAAFGTKPKDERYNIAVPGSDGYIGWFCVPRGYVVYVDGSSNVCDFGKGTDEFSRIAVYAADGVTAAALANAIWIGGSECERRLSETLGGSYCMVGETVNGDLITSSGAEESGLFIFHVTEGEQREKSDR